MGDRMNGSSPLERKTFGKLPQVLPLPNLIELQTESYRRFLQADVPADKRERVGLQATFLDVFPVVGYDNPSSLEFVSYTIAEPKYTVSECQRRGLTYAAPLKVKMRLVIREKNADGGDPYVQDVREQEVYMGEVPLITEHGTFVINGAERVIVSQLHRSPGVSFDHKVHPSGKKLHTGRIIPYRGAWVEFECDVNDVLFVSIDRKRKLASTVLLRALGFGATADIIKLFYETEQVSVNRRSARGKLVGRVAAADVPDPSTNEIIVNAADEITEELVDVILDAKVKSLELVAGGDVDKCIVETLRSDPVQSEQEALIEVYHRLRPGDPPTVDNARRLFRRLFFDPKYFDLAAVGRHKLNRKLGLSAPADETVLTKEDFLEAMRYIIGLRSGSGNEDDIDHLGNRRVRSNGELVQNQFRIGLARIERLIKERMSIQDMATVMPQNLVNAKLVAAAIKDFFGRSQLSQFMDQTNPLAELAHKRRLSALGQGGLSRDRASFEVRDVHFSHYGRICPVETPEGPNIGLIAQMSTFARVNDLGFLETPYRRVKNGVVTDEIEYLDAQTEDLYVVAQANAPVDEKGRLVGDDVLCRSAQDYVSVPPAEVHYMDVSPKQLVSVAAALIPFLEHNDPTRALMGSNMQRQAVPLLQTEAPYVGTGLEHVTARDSGVAPVAKRPGTVVDVSADLVLIQGEDGEIDMYHLTKFRRSNQSTTLNQRPIVKPGQKVSAGQVIADGPAMKNGDLALGRNVLVSFMPWGGHNFEDAILISERILKEDIFTSIHVEEFEIEARDTKLGREEITRDIPNVGEDTLRDLDSTGIVRIGAEVGPGDILVGKVTPKSETELSPEEKLLRAIFGEKSADVRDASLKVPPGLEGIVVDVKVFSRKERGLSEAGTAFEQREIDRIFSQYELRIQALRRAMCGLVGELCKGDVLAKDFTDSVTGVTIAESGETVDDDLLMKMAGHGFAGLKITGKASQVSQIRAIAKEFDERIQAMRLQCDEEIERIRRGDELPPGVIKMVKVYVASKRKLSVGDKMAGRHGNKGVVAKILPEEDMPFLPDGTPVEIVLNPLGVPSRMNVGQILETHLGWAARSLGLHIATPVFDGASEAEIEELLVEGGLPENGTTALYDGRSGERFAQEVTVGYIYMMKLSHLVDDKVHARSIGPYSLVTQQPLGGKAQMGGQRFGEMEVWALEAYGAAHTLQELLTVKSDDVVGRTRIYEAIVKGENTLQPGIPESFNVLIKELQSLCLDIRTERTNGEEKEEEEPFPFGADLLHPDRYGRGESQGVNSFDSIKIGIASPETILSWSRGEVKKPETINYRTFKPEKDGLFCEKIFGPTKDWECNCGKYKRIKHRGVVCDRCGVEVTQSKVRRERMGHITLAAPVSHVWFFKVSPSIMGNLLDMGVRTLERILYYEEYVVLDPGNTDLKVRQLLTDEEFRTKVEELGAGSFDARMGAEAVRELLRDLDLNSIAEELREDLGKTGSKQKRQRLTKRLRIVEQFRNSGNRPEWMVLDVIAVIPPDLRPLVPLDGGRFATSDLNDLYRRVINRNERLRHLLRLSAPDVIIRNEKRMLQEAVDALFDNGRQGRAVMGPGNRPLKSLSDMLRGKPGRFRQNLLGKRVDYSGRSVIVIGPELKLHQCALPKKMALELFEPFIIRKLKERGFVHTIKSAKRMVERVKPEVWDILEEVVNETPVLLNRAPTLHRLGIQAFEPVLVDGKGIRIHPLVCKAFNADFDGDMMAVHVPLSLEAQLESRLLMLSTNNIFSPGSGDPITIPTQDIVLGCYYLTRECRGESGEGMVFSGPTECLLAYDLGQVGLHARVKVRVRGEMVSTTPGRVLLTEKLPAALPEHLRMRVLRVGEPITQSSLSDLINGCYKALGQAATVEMLDTLKNTGFEWATLGGMSISIRDMRIPPEKSEFLGRARKAVAEVEEQYQLGFITEGERYNKVVDIWTSCTDELSDKLFEGLELDRPDVPGGVSIRGVFNPMFMMADSGARGSRLQIRQLAGMRGLLAKPSGEIIETPITSNFREGLTVLEYFISTHGARKGLADTALKTADSGYLTRRLVDVAQDVIVTEVDCGTFNGITVQGLYEGEEMVIPISERVIGRTTCEDVVIPLLGDVIVKAGEVIDDDAARAIEEAGIDEVRIRSVLTCESRQGICQKCYGWSLARRDQVSIGEAVGIIAAQSIGEPGTQLTMRTFHIGGTASRVIEKSRVGAKYEGDIRFHNLRAVVNRDGDMIAINRNGSISVHDDEGRELERHFLLAGAIISVEDGGKVAKGAVMAEWDPYTMSILTEVSGTARFEDMIEDVTVRQELDEVTGRVGRVIIDHKEDKHPQIVITDESGEILTYYSIPSGAHVIITDGDEVLAGDVLAKIPREIQRTKDITGGLPRVVELFEARKPKNPSVITEIDGTVEFAGSAKGMRKIAVRNEETGLERAYLIPPGKHLNVYKGDHVVAGEALIEGPIVPQDILAVKGERALQEYLLTEVQEVYRLQGVKINDKHIEVIIRQMLRKIEIEDPGDTVFLPGEHVDRWVFADENTRVADDNGKPASARSVLLGITKASLSTESFISAASFQQTTAVLTQAAAAGKRDGLRGLKENVIMGHLIPAGTGMKRYADTDIETDMPDIWIDEPPASADEGEAEFSEVESQG